MEEIFPGIWRFQGAISNAYLIVEHRCCLLVDTGLPSDAEELLKALGGIEETMSLPVFIVLTHLHPDHAGGLSQLRPWLDGIVVLTMDSFALPGKDIQSPTRFPPRKDWVKLIRLWRSQKGRIPSLRDVFGLLVAVLRGYTETVIDAKSILLVEDGSRIPATGGWQLISTPNHTRDCVCLYHPTRKILITGDTIVEEEGKAVFTFDREGAEVVIQRLGNLNVEIVLPGHGNFLQGERILTKLLQKPLHQARPH